MNRNIGEIERITSRLHENLSSEGCRGEIVSVMHVEELRSEIDEWREDGLIDEDVYEEELRSFDFQYGDVLPSAESIIIATAPQPQVSVRFNLSGESRDIIIPPIYDKRSDETIRNLLVEALEPGGYKLAPVYLPEKLLAVHSGLAEYGKNNITYVDGMGSFHRFKAFLTDLPCVDERWSELRAMEICSNCLACKNQCPSGAIAGDRFLVHAEKCVTFHNERKNEFPEWLDLEWHKCLVGCMDCQLICPADIEFKGWIDAGAEFTEDETERILNGSPAEDLPPEVLGKIRNSGLLEYLNVLPRNLQAALRNSHNQSASLRISSDP